MGCGTSGCNVERTGELLVVSTIGEDELEATSVLIDEELVIGAALVDETTDEQTVGVIKLPSAPYGLYPRHEAYAAAHVDLLLSAAPRHSSYAVLHVATQASTLIADAGELTED